MRRRPKQNVRRGFLRAAAAVVALTIVILAAILVVSTFTAPKAKAPTVPLTPTVGTPSLTPATTIAPTPKPAKTATTPGKKKKTSSMRSGAALADRVLSAHGSARINPVASPNGRYVAYFWRAGNAYARNPLFLLDRSLGQSRQIGFGDPLVRPVWAKDGNSVLYVRVASTKRFPGAEWSLVRGERSGSTVLTRASGLSLVPLGWSAGKALYILASATDTGIFAVAPGHLPVFKSILFPQVITGASLSPDESTIAFSVPTNCAFCTVDLFHLDTLTTTYGPSGWGSPWNMAWTGDSSMLVTPGRDGLALLQPRDGSVRYAPAPSGLSRVWPDPMRASLHGSVVRLVDTISGREYSTAY